MKPAPNLLAVDEAARELGVSRATVWRLLRAGRLASTRIGGRRRIPREAVLAVARQGTAPGGPDTWPVFTEGNPLFALAGIFRGRGPGSSEDKQAVWRRPRPRRR
jgi:excisionase family DNA binding protein